LEKYKLGIVGFITNTTASIIANGDKLKCSILDPIVTVQNSIDILKGQGINRIIGLSHNGYEDDIYVAKNVKGLQLIVGGHSHSLLLDTNYSPLGNVAGRYPTTVISSLDKKSTYIVQAHRFGDYLGHVDLEWDNNDELVKISGKPILLDQTIIKDENMDTLVKEYAKSFHTITNDVVTSSTGNFPPCADSKQCSMGKLITNCMLSEQRTRPIKPEIALINTGGIRATFSTGPVTASAILAVLPFGNSVTNFYMSGKELSRVLARAAIATGPSKPISAPQWSGLDFKIEEGNVTNIKVNGIDLELSNSYALTSIDFLVDGGDNILEKITPAPVPEIVLADLVTTCLRKLKQISP
jgi:5'-nucleotidase